MVPAVCLALVLALVPSIAAAQTAQTQPPKQMPKQAPVQAPVKAPAAAVKPIPPEVLNAMRTGAGRYEVSGVDIHLQGYGDMPGYQPSQQYLNADSSDDSVIVIRGTVHGAGVLAPNGKVPTDVFNVWFDYRPMFPGIPATCQLRTVGYPQSNKFKSTYITYIIVKDTRHLAECWKYFASMKTAETEILQVKTYSEPSLPTLPMTDGGKRLLTLGPLLPKTPAP